MTGKTATAVLGLRDRVRHHPLPAGPHRTLTLALLDAGLSDALYSRSDWLDLATAITGALNGDGSSLVAFADEQNGRNPDGSYSNFVDAISTIYCNDSEPGPTDAAIRAAAARWAAELNCSPGPARATPSTTAATTASTTTSIASCSPDSCHHSEPSAGHKPPRRWRRVARLR